MPSLISDYLPLVVFIIIGGLIWSALLVAPFLVAYRNPDPEKLSAYECGFNPFDDARMKFDMRFYLVSLLFIIFDLEVAFLFPWAVGVPRDRPLRLLVDDHVPGRADGRLRLRMEKGSVGMGLSPLVAPAPRGIVDPARAGQSARTTLISAGSTTNSPTRASSSPRRTTSSTGRAPAR